MGEGEVEAEVAGVFTQPDGAEKEVHALDRQRLPIPAPQELQLAGLVEDLAHAQLRKRREER